MSGDFYRFLTWTLVLSAVALHVFTLQDALNIRDLQGRVSAIEEAK